MSTVPIAVKKLMGGMMRVLRIRRKNHQNILNDSITLEPLNTEYQDGAFHLKSDEDGL